jgi:hypothetical protein
MNKIYTTVLVLLLAFAAAVSAMGIRAKSQVSRKYDFEGGISKEVLVNYLSRAITQGEFCHEADDAVFNENLRMLKNIGAKFIGRAAFVWTPAMTDDKHFEIVTARAKQAHNADPEFVLQCCIFEAVFKSDNELTDFGVDQIRIPEFVFKEFNLPVQVRNFSYEAMLYKEGRYKDHWVKGASVPDVSKIETQMYFFYRAARYIDAGFEGIHLGQVALMNANDPGNKIWFELTDRIREYARKNGRRKFVMLDAHVPTGGYLSDDGRLLLDFHSFPQRPKEICETPYHAELEIGFHDAIFKRSKGGITPSGWKCGSLPYLIELDNSGASNPGVCGGEEWWWPWGWDEITWFAHCDEDYRNYWLEYVVNWLKENDPVGHLQMPGSTTIAADPIGDIWMYRINTKSEACPTGFSQEETVKRLWSE